MGAAWIMPDPAIPVPSASISSATLGIAVVVMALVILAASFAVVLVDRELARRAAEEARRLKAFADAAVEGLLVVDGDKVVDANHSFRQLMGIDSSQSTGSPAPDFPRSRSCRLACEQESRGGDMDSKAGDGTRGKSS